MTFNKHPTCLPPRNRACHRWQPSPVKPDWLPYRRPDSSTGGFWQTLKLGRFSTSVTMWLLEHVKLHYMVKVTTRILHVLFMYTYPFMAQTAWIISDSICSSILFNIMVRYINHSWMKSRTNISKLKLNKHKLKSFSDRMKSMIFFRMFYF